jgi:hypothetical protein
VLPFSYVETLDCEYVPCSHDTGVLTCRTTFPDLVAAEQYSKVYSKSLRLIHSTIHYFVVAAVIFAVLARSLAKASTIRAPAVAVASPPQGSCIHPSISF